MKYFNTITKTINTIRNFPVYSAIVQELVDYSGTYLRCRDDNWVWSLWRGRRLPAPIRRTCYLIPIRNSHRVRKPSPHTAPPVLEILKATAQHFVILPFSSENKPLIRINLPLTDPSFLVIPCDIIAYVALCFPHYVLSLERAAQHGTAGISFSESVSVLYINYSYTCIFLCIHLLRAQSTLAAWKYDKF